MVRMEHVNTLSPAAGGMRFFIILSAAALCILAFVFQLNCVGAEVRDVPQPLKDLAMPTLDTATMGMSQSAWSVGVNQWLKTNLFKPGFAPFSFVYEGKCFKEFLAVWEFTI